jgi:hypothetical protein
MKPTRFILEIEKQAKKLMPSIFKAGNYLLNGAAISKSWSALTVLPGLAGNPSNIKHVLPASALRIGGSGFALKRSLTAGQCRLVVLMEYRSTGV